MKRTAPPAIAAWLLRHLGPRNEALAGDLLEEYRRQRSDGWYWRQVLTAIVVGRSTQVLVVVGMLALFKLGTYLPVPGADTRALVLVGARGPGPLATFDVITGGNLSWVTLLALGIAPYVTASIVVQSIAIAWWALTRRTATPWDLPIVRATWLTAMVLCVVQAAGIAMFLERQTIAAGGIPLVAAPGWAFRASTILLVTAGTAGLMWLCDAVTRRGWGNGLFLTFVAALLAGAPALVVAGGIQALSRLLVPVVLVGLTSLGYRRAFHAA